MYIAAKTTSIRIQDAAYQILLKCTPSRRHGILPSRPFLDPETGLQASTNVLLLVVVLVVVIRFSIP